MPTAVFEAGHSMFDAMTHASDLKVRVFFGRESFGDGVRHVATWDCTPKKIHGKLMSPIFESASLPKEVHFVAAVLLPLLF